MQIFKTSGSMIPGRDDIKTPFVALTHEPLDYKLVTDVVRSPGAGAIVIFAGTTRDTFGDKPVKELTYTAYERLAGNTMMSICREIRHKYALKGIAMVHRLGTVPIGEESILIAVSAAHREAAWMAGHEALEQCKQRVEIWKKEEFHGEEGIWRANRDGAKGEKVADIMSDKTNSPQKGDASKDKPMPSSIDNPLGESPIARSRRSGRSINTRNPILDPSSEDETDDRPSKPNRSTPTRNPIMDLDSGDDGVTQSKK